jgi:hypothetical protein
MEEDHCNLMREFKLYINKLDNKIHSIKKINIDEFIHNTQVIKDMINDYNNSIDEWYDEKFNKDIENFKNSFKEFNSKIDNYNDKQFIVFT